MDNIKRHNHLMATDWNYAIKEDIKTGLSNPTLIQSSIYFFQLVAIFIYPIY